MGKRACKFRNVGCTRQVESSEWDYCQSHRCRVCREGVRNLSDSYCNIHVCIGHTETSERCKLKRLGLSDGKPSSHALGYYCQEHSCNKCGIREEADFCRKCECAAMNCYDGRSDKYKKSVYCTEHTCTKCRVRNKGRSETRCAVC